MPYSRMDNCEFLGQLIEANAAFKERVQRNVQPIERLKSRIDKPNKVVVDGEGGFENCVNKLKENISDDISNIILWFLYAHKYSLSDHPADFTSLYESLFDKKKWDTIMRAFPRIDQTTFSKVVNINDSTLCNRLEDLETAGYISRSLGGPPSPKFVEITERGCLLIDEWVQETRERLAPLFVERTEIADNDCSSQPNTQAER